MSRIKTNGKWFLEIETKGQVQLMEITDKMHINVLNDIEPLLISNSGKKLKAKLEEITQESIKLNSNRDLKMPKQEVEQIYSKLELNDYLYLVLTDKLDDLKISYIESG